MPETAPGHELLLVVDRSPLEPRPSETSVGSGGCCPREDVKCVANWTFGGAAASARKMQRAWWEAVEPYVLPVLEQDGRLAAIIAAHEDELDEEDLQYERDQPHTLEPPSRWVATTTPSTQAQACENALKASARKRIEIARARGDIVRDVTGRLKPITALNVRELGDQRVYNLTVAGVHTFHVGTQRLLVHNCGGGADDVPKGGVYSLRDDADDVVRTGRSKNLKSREGDHRRDPDLKDFKFRPEHRTDDYATQRGLEQKLHDQYTPRLNKIRPISPKNKRRPTYLRAADSFLRRLGGQ